LDKKQKTKKNNKKRKTSNKNKLNSTAVVPVVVNKKKLQLKKLLSEEDEKVDSTSTSSGTSEKTTTNDSATDTIDTIPQIIELLRSKLQTREHFMVFFTQIDKDNSGACSKKEFGRLIKNILKKKKTTTPINNIIQLAWKQASGNAMSDIEMEKNVLADFIFGKEVAELRISSKDGNEVEWNTSEVAHVVLSNDASKEEHNAAIAAAEALEIKAKKDAELAVKKSAKPAEKKEEEAAMPKTAKDSDTNTKSQTNNANDVNIRVPSRDEIDQFRKQIRAKIKNDRNKLKKIFDKLDNNKSDTLCKQEFGNLLRAVMQKVPSEALLAAIWSDATSEKKKLDIKNWIQTTDEKKELDIATLTEWVFISTPEEMAAAMLELDLDSSDEEIELHVDSSDEELPDFSSFIL